MAGIVNCEPEYSHVLEYIAIGVNFVYLPTPCKEILK